MTQPSDADRDWDEELVELVDGILNDANSDGAPIDLVDTPAAPAAPDQDIATLLAERTGDLQRLQAEYINYKRRVDRDRDLARQRGIEAVLWDLLPVLDGIDAAKAHGEMNEGATMLADAVAKVTEKYGLTSFGQEGDPFDPHVHEALMHVDKPGLPANTVATVLQKGYAIAERVVRPARVGVTESEEPTPDADPRLIEDEPPESARS